MKNKVLTGKCEEVLGTIPDETIDMILTDPPYGIEFMGKDWDKALPSKKAFQECFRVLKEGAWCFVMSSPRQDVLYRMSQLLESCGFEIGFTSIYWTYASGFPKAANISKGIDKKLGAEREVIGKYQYPDSIERKISDCPESYIASKKSGCNPITAPKTLHACAYDGAYAGFQPKPALEVILVVMKPLPTDTYLEGCYQHGKGITWLDDCRIPFVSEKDKKLGQSERPSLTTNDFFPSLDGFDRSKRDHIEGRFPANLLVSDDVLNDGEITSSFRPNKFGVNYAREKKDQLIFKDQDTKIHCSYPDSGSFSRYFSLDAWWEERIKKLPESVQKTFPFLIVPKASKSEKNKGLKPKGYTSKRPSGVLYNEQEPDGFRDTLKRGNYHPTVKPIKLGSYLVLLGSRKDDIILDPYCGSGSFLISAKINRRNFIGIELVPEYCEIAIARLNAYHTSKSILDWVQPKSKLSIETPFDEKLSTIEQIIKLRSENKSWRKISIDLGLSYEKCRQLYLESQVA